MDTTEPPGSVHGACAHLSTLPHIHPDVTHASLVKLALCKHLIPSEMVLLGQQLPLTDSRSVLPGGFWAAVDVWLQKPQVVNRRLCGSQSQQCGQGRGHYLSQVKEDLSHTSAGEDEELLLNIAEAVDPQQVLLRTLIPKTNPHYSSEPGSELVIKDLSNGTVTFVPLKKMHEGSIQVMRSNVYQIQLAHIKNEEWSLSVRVLCPEDWQSDGVVHPKQMWLINDLLPKLAKWAMEQKKSEFKDTLSLISVVRYSKLYQELKDKYKEIVKVWPEVTDPEKFVYEDVAIATYLLILWEDERAEKGLSKKQSFVDLGCGNGLLVHILTNEGHQGKGLDVRRRKIWDMYGEQTQLEECAITPSDDYLFPDADWLIGNHSDELTPWLPMIAARSSYSCCYFVLPCCFFNFYGKYIRKKSKKTQYREYLDFIIKVGTECGFKVEEDCLRIPSTKRVCLIGNSRTYQPKDEPLIDEKRKQFIKEQPSKLTTLNKDLERCHVTDSISVTEYFFLHDNLDSDETANLPFQNPKNSSNTTGSKSWLSGFLPRQKIEQTRNCASLPRDFIDQVVLRVADLLLSSSNEQADESVYKEHVDTWNCGKSLPLQEVAEYLGSETLQRLKKECGGLQTLLRNNHQVFDAHDARVHIRDWRNEDAGKRPKQEFRKRPPSALLKTRLCWFFVNHPDGCPLVSDKCLFAHGAEELREVAQKKKL